MAENSEPAAEWISPVELIGWKSNPRKIDKAVRRVARSIKRYGFGSPIVARRENREIIAGHVRHAAAIRLKLDRVPVRFLDCDEKTAHALAIADNKLGELAEWDETQLDRLLTDMDEGDLEIAGFDDDEIDKALGIELPDRVDAQIDRGEARGLSYKLLVECEDETQQALLMEEMEKRGHSCKPVIA